MAEVRVVIATMDGTVIENLVVESDTINFCTDLEFAKQVREHIENKFETEED